jgi:hypothetical protein
MQWLSSPRRAWNPYICHQRPPPVLWMLRSYTAAEVPPHPPLFPSCARVLPYPDPLSYPNTSIPAPQEKTDDNAMTPWGCPHDDVTRHSLVDMNRVTPLWLVTTRSEGVAQPTAILLCQPFRSTLHPLSSFWAPGYHIRSHTSSGPVPVSLSPLELYMSPGGVARHARGWRKWVVAALREKLSRLNTNNICEQQIHHHHHHHNPTPSLYPSKGWQTIKLSGRSRRHWTLIL